MRKIKIVALVLVCVMLLSGCSLVSPDEEKIAMQVVATVNGVEIYKYEVEADAEDYARYYYGIDPESVSEEERDVYQDLENSVLEDFVASEVLLQKAAELGFELTADEKAENLVRAKDYFVSIKDSFITQVEAETAQTAVEEATKETDEATEEPAEELVEEAEQAQIVVDPEVLAEAEIRYQEYIVETRLTQDMYYEFLCEQDLVSQVRDYIFSLAEVTDDAVQTWYDQTLAMQQEEMDAAAGSFESLVNANSIYTYIPQTIVAVRDMLIAFDEELALQAEDLFYAGEMDAYDDFLDILLVSSSDYFVSAIDVKQRIEGGELIEDIIAELSESEQNIRELSPKNGYLIDPRTINYAETYKDSALGLEAIGDVSEPFADYKGVHILQKIKVYEPGVIAFDDVKDSIKTALLPGAEQEMYEKLLEEWIDEADIKYFYNRLE